MSLCKLEDYTQQTTTYIVLLTPKLIETGEDVYFQIQVKLINKNQQPRKLKFLLKLSCTTKMQQ